MNCGVYFADALPHLRSPLFGTGRMLVRALIIDSTIGPVDIHLSHIMAPTRNSIDTNDSAVFS
jgi:hypothetical protein